MIYYQATQIQFYYFSLCCTNGFAGCGGCAWILIGEWPIHYAIAYIPEIAGALSDLPPVFTSAGLHGPHRLSLLYVRRLPHVILFTYGSFCSGFASFCWAILLGV